jgi:RNA polymerase sigma-70 factor (ECF subfamily)
VIAVPDGGVELEASPDGGWPDGQLADRELHQVLEAALERLPTRTRQAFELCRFQQLSYKQTASAMGISVKTVGVHIGRALFALRKAVLPYLAGLILLAQ